MFDLFSKVNGFTKSTKKFYSAPLGLLGLAFVVVSVAVSWYFLKELLAMIVAAFGCGIGGFFIGSAKKYLSTADIEKEREKIEKDIRQSIEFETTKEQLDNITKQAAELQLEKERLERMQISVSIAAPILKLGLSEVKLQWYDYYLKVLRNETEKIEHWYGNETVEYYDEFIGLKHVTMDANLGIDLKKINVLDYNNILYISGIKTELQGSKNRKWDWKLKEIRRKKTLNGKVEPHTIDHDDRYIHDLADEQDKSFEERLNVGLEFAHHDKYIEQMAQSFIQLWLAPTGKQIMFINSQDNAKALPIEAFVQSHNEKLSNEIKLLDIKTEQHV